MTRFGTLGSRGVWDWSVITPACKMTDVKTHETLRSDDEAARPGVLVGYVSEQLANERWELEAAVGAGMHAPRGADFSHANNPT